MELFHFLFLFSILISVSLQQTPSLPGELYLEFAPIGYFSASYKAQYLNAYSAGVSDVFSSNAQTIPLNLTYNCAENYYFYRIGNAISLPNPNSSPFFQYCFYAKTNLSSLCTDDPFPIIFGITMGSKQVVLQPDNQAVILWNVTNSAIYNTDQFVTSVDGATLGYANSSNPLVSFFTEFKTPDPMNADLPTGCFPYSYYNPGTQDAPFFEKEDPFKYVREPHHILRALRFIK